MEQVTAIIPIPDWIPTPRNLQVHEALDYAKDYVFKIIKERRESDADHGDVLSALLNASTNK